jgi:hypothetical protein
MSSAQPRLPSTGGAGGSSATGGAGGSTTTGGADGSTTTGGAGGSSATGGAGGSTTTDGGGGSANADARADATATDGSGGGATIDSGGSSGDGGPAACGQDPTTAAQTAAVFDAANALKAKLTTAQQTTVQLDWTVANARRWSNFPTSVVTRNGVPLRDMSADAQTAALNLVSVATSTTGSTLLAELRAADQWLVTDAMQSTTTFGEGLYYIAFLGTPSTTAKWLLQITGHHLAHNISFNTTCATGTPFFDGAEPMNWNDGTMSHAPIESQRTAMTALLAAVSSAPESKLTGTFSDLLNGPVGTGATGGDTKYPLTLSYPTGTTGRGVNLGGQAANVKALAKTAIETWVKNVSDPLANSLLTDYESDTALAQTYVAYAGSADLSTQGSYIRIDGPRVWIEASVQAGATYKTIVHWHTIWRDKAADYGAEFR